MSRRSSSPRRCARGPCVAACAPRARHRGGWGAARVAPTRPPPPDRPHPPAPASPEASPAPPAPPPPAAPTPPPPTIDRHRKRCLVSLAKKVSTALSQEQV